VAGSLIHQPPNWVDRLDWQAVFGNTRPVEVDLGCGKGAFLLQIAAARPEINFLGVDRLLGRLRKVDVRAQHRGLGNVRLLRIEGGYLVAYLLPPQSVAVCPVYFPDPWPKRRHHRRRLFSPQFVAEVHATLVADGELRVATDHADYFKGICGVVNGSGRFLEIAAADASVGAGTDFERKFSAEGRAIHRARWRKRAGGLPKLSNA
jgi:tRNA (guanine-N7-)-methyltransferase